MSIAISSDGTASATSASRGRVGADGGPRVVVSVIGGLLLRPGDGRALEEETARVCRTHRCGDVRGPVVGRGRGRDGARAGRRTAGPGTRSSRLLPQVEPVEVHDLVPRGDEVARELLLRVLAAVELRERPQLGV